MSQPSRLYVSPFSTNCSPGRVPDDLGFLVFYSLSLTLTTWSAYISANCSGSYLCIWRPNSSSAGLMPMIVWGSALYAVYLFSSRLRCLSYAWAMCILLSENLFHLTIFLWPLNSSAFNWGLLSILIGSDGPCRLNIRSRIAMILLVRVWLSDDHRLVVSAVIIHNH